MTHWKWINDNGDIYLQSKVATVRNEDCTKKKT